MKLFGFYIENYDFRHKMEQWRIDFFQMKVERDSLEYRLELLKMSDDTREQIEYQQKMLTLHGADVDSAKGRIAQLERACVDCAEDGNELGRQIARIISRLTKLEKLHPQKK